jgi:hypothetical protein
VTPLPSQVGIDLKFGLGIAVPGLVRADWPIGLRSFRPAFSDCQAAVRSRTKLVDAEIHQGPSEPAFEFGLLLDFVEEQPQRTDEVAG